MKELKTLKDIEGFSKEDNRKARGLLILEDRERIKAEAVKWVKTMSEPNAENYNAIKHFMNFFNLTEEDLKDEVESALIKKPCAHCKENDNLKKLMDNQYYLGYNRAKKETEDKIEKIKEEIMSLSILRKNSDLDFKSEFVDIIYDIIDKIQRGEI
jgi:hypothetical protein